MKRLFIFSLFLITSLPLFAQDFGLSFSYFLPKNGYFSTPISPFSVRGVGVSLNKFLALQTGASLYRMSGLNLKELPFESKKPLVGPNFTLFVPAELVIEFTGNAASFHIKGGGFFFYCIGNKINYGNFDEALRKYEDWQVANGDFSFDSKPGFGYFGGVELILNVTATIGISIETNYLIGESKFPVTGTYSGGNSSIETKTADFNDARIDFTGWELSLGVFYSTGQGKSPKKRRR